VDLSVATMLAQTANVLVGMALVAVAIAVTLALTARSDR
jgi:hypothetical protein